MNGHKRTSKFGIGVILGAIGGAIAGLFLSPGTGEENREKAAKEIEKIKKILKDREVDTKIKEIFGELSDSSREAYDQVKDTLAQKLADLRLAISEIDRDKYGEAVHEAIDEVKDEHALSEDTLIKLKKYLVEDFKKLKSPITAKTAKKPAVKSKKNSRKPVAKKAK